MQDYRSSVTEKVIGCAIEVHRTVGPGLLESAYERCLAKELSDRGISYSTQVAVPLSYRLPQGLVINFNVQLLRNGLCSVVNTSLQK